MSYTVMVCLVMAYVVMTRSEILKRGGKDGNEGSVGTCAAGKPRFDAGGSGGGDHRAAGTI